LAEYGIVAAKGSARARELMALAISADCVPALAREALSHLVEQIRDTERRIVAFDKQIMAIAKSNPLPRVGASVAR
jgi:hypothetical protein